MNTLGKVDPPTVVFLKMYCKEVLIQLVSGRLSVEVCVPEIKMEATELKLWIMNRLGENHIIVIVML